jgi:recombination protein RecT
VTAQTVGNAVAKRDEGAAELIRQSREWFATIVPSHIDARAFVALGIAYLRKNPKLADAAKRNPQAFMAALSECARLGLVPGDTYHLVPFEDRRNSTVEITGITDYKGEIELIYRAGAVASVKAEIVYRNDAFRYSTDMDRPEHSPDWFGDRGELIGAYAYAVMKDGATSKVVIYSKAEIDRVKAVAKGTDRADSPWKAWYDRMALKTVIHRLESFVPTSAEYRREQLRAAAEVSQQVNAAAAAPRMEATPARDDGAVVDAEIVDEPGSTWKPREPEQPAGHRTRQNRQPQPPDDPHEALTWHLDRLKVVMYGDQMTYLTRLAGEPVASPDSITREQAAALAAVLAGCGSADELEAEAVAREAARDEQ